MKFENGRLIGQVQCPKCGYLMEIQRAVIQGESKVVCTISDCENFDKVALVVFPTIGLRFVEEKDADNPALASLRGLEEQPK